jgi:hypothetical protein
MLMECGESADGPQEYRQVDVALARRSWAAHRHGCDVATIRRWVVGRKLSAFIACLAGAMLLITPSALAAISVTGMTPSSGVEGATVQCAVTGAFNVPLNVDIDGKVFEAPTFSLDNGVDPAIAGVTDPSSVTATSANVSFTLPWGTPAVRYTLRASQIYKIWIIANTYRASLPDAFQVVPTISSLSPDIAKAGADVTLTVNGGGFIASSADAEGASVRWNGESLATTFVSATRLTAIVPAARLTTAGTADVTVTNVAAGTTSAGRTFTIDTSKPSTAALNAASVKRGATVKLKFRVGEPAGQSPTAKVVVRVKAAKGGKIAKTITVESVPVNVDQSVSFKVTLKKGAYRWYVSATDLAGNTEANVAVKPFIVK